MTVAQTKAAAASGLHVTPLDVAGGYRRHGEPVNSHLYRSDNGYMGDYHCADDSCRLSSEVRVAFNQYVNGGTSKKWSLWFTQAVLVKSSLKWSYTYVYYCAVNIPHGVPDHYCKHPASPSDEHGGTKPNTAKTKAQEKGLWKDFEHSSSSVNYPMYGLTIHWSDGVSQTAKFRGWDTCNYYDHTDHESKVYLCDSSGTGA